MLHDRDDDWNDEDDVDGQWDEVGEEECEDDDEPTIPCPYCGAEIHEDSVRCPRCEHYLSTEDSPPSSKPWWIVIGAALCLYAVYRWTVG